MKSKYRGAIYATALLLLIIVITHMGFWIYTANQHETFLEAKAAYLNAFPSPLQNAVLLTAIDIWLLAVAGFIFAQSINAAYKKTLSTVLALLCGFLGAWNLISLM